VKEYLMNAGISKDRVITKGFGKRKPLIENKDDDSRAQNRRVEMKITN
jgi:OOP family OmpA-OmpF porin